MAIPTPLPYLQTNDVIVADNGDGTVMVKRYPFATGDTSAGSVIVITADRPEISSAPRTLYYEVTAPQWRPLPRKFVPDFTPYPKLSGALRNQRCPKCGKKFKVCGHAPHGGARAGGSGEGE